MRFQSLDSMVRDTAVTQATGPVAAVIADDEVEVASTLRHHIDAGFKTVFLFAPADLDVPPTLADAILRCDFPTRDPGITPRIVNALVAALPARTWFYYCYNAEYLFYPFSETRTVGEMLAFHAEERRFSMLTYVVDLYASKLDAAENAVSLEDAHLDRSGYYALARNRADDQIMDRQLDFFGGLRWRFEEHIAPERRRIDRISIVRCRPGLELRDDHTWTDEELNTYSCPWHHNLTAAIVSFRTAKALRTNPASRYDIATFQWHNSIAFEWHSQQLLDLGLMEPGQWF